MKIGLGRNGLKIVVAGLVLGIASSTLASPLTVRCPQDGETAQRISEEDKASIRGCPDGGTISTYSHVHVSGTASQTHTFLMVDCK